MISTVAVGTDGSESQTSWSSWPVSAGRRFGDREQGMRRKMLGSVPNSITHKAGCSVLVVKTT
jgi:nucleotide-binding universal stress UspA family protein